MAGIAARRYVKAVYELALEAGSQETALKDMQQVNRLMQESEELQQFILNPSIGSQKKINVFEELTGQLDISKTVSGLVRLLIHKNRMELLDDIVKEYALQEHERQGIINMELKTANTLDEKLRLELKKKFEESTGKSVEIEATVDESVIGGMVARIGGTIYDGSIEHQLNLIQQRLGE